MKNKTNILGIAFVILIILFISAIIYIQIKPNKNKKVVANDKLNSEQIISLMNHAVANITSIDNLESNAIPDDEMIAFAICYMQTTGEYEIMYSDYDTVATVKLSDVEQVVKYIFDKEINYSNVTHDIHDDMISVTIYMGSTDLKIYKYKQQEYDESKDEYYAYIDCLEPENKDYEMLEDSSTTEYAEDNVIQTIIFKYKQLEGRRVLLSYKLENKEY